jgi:hypothetical protein
MGECISRAPNDIILQEGYAADHVFLLCTGQAKLLTSSS